MPPRKNIAAITNAALLAATLLLGAAGQGCAHAAAPKDTRAEDETAIRAYSRAFNDAVRAKDADKAASFYADDAFAFGGGEPTTTSREATLAGMQSDFSDKGWTIDWNTDAIMVARSGDLAYERGHYLYTFTGSDGKPGTQTGHYLLVWKKSPGADWKIAVDTDSADPPPAPPAK